MTNPLSEVTGQHPDSTENGKTEELPHDHGSKTNNIFIKPYNASEQIYSDQTLIFPITSSKGYKYFMIVYEYDSNHIYGEQIKSRNVADLTREYKKCTKCSHHEACSHNYIY